MVIAFKCICLRGWLMVGLCVCCASCAFTTSNCLCGIDNWHIDYVTDNSLKVGTERNRGNDNSFHMQNIINPFNTMKSPAMWLFLHFKIHHRSIYLWAKRRFFCLLDRGHLKFLLTTFMCYTCSIGSEYFFYIFPFLFLS